MKLKWKRQNTKN